MRLIRLATADEWMTLHRKGGLSCPEGGYIHLCTEVQASLVKESVYGPAKVLILEVEANVDDLQWEPAEGDDEAVHGLFPHLYADLPLKNIVALREF